MKTPLIENLKVLYVVETTSTQTVARDVLTKAVLQFGDAPAEPHETISEGPLEGSQIGVVWAENQTKGRGRFDREWLSAKGASLTASLIFREYADHPMPHIIGMSLAIAAAKVLECKLQWPNDLILDNRKVGGILTELIKDRSGRFIPVIGIGLNLGTIDFPEALIQKATSVQTVKGRRISPSKALFAILAEISSLPEPNSWASIEDEWCKYDVTPGKAFLLHDGESAVAVGITADGGLLVDQKGKKVKVLAADAWNLT